MADPWQNGLYPPPVAPELEGMPAPGDAAPGDVAPGEWPPAHWLDRSEDELIEQPEVDRAAVDDPTPETPAPDEPQGFYTPEGAPVAAAAAPAQFDLGGELAQPMAPVPLPVDRWQEFAAARPDDPAPFAPQYDIESPPLEQPGIEYSGGDVPYDEQQASQAFKDHPELLEQPGQLRADRVPDEFRPQALANAQQRDQEMIAAENRRLAAEAALEAEERADIYRTAKQRTQEKISAINDRYQKLAQTNTDPERWWANRSTGQKIAAYIGAALGGWLNPGGRNTTLEMMQGAIEQDLQEQRMNLERALNGLSFERNAMIEFYEATGDAEAAESAARIASLKQAQEAYKQRLAELDPNGTQALAGARDVAEMERKAKMAQAELAKKQTEVEAEEERIRRENEKLEEYKKSEAASRAKTFSDIRMDKRKQDFTEEKDRLERAEKQAERESEHRRLSRDPLVDAIARVGGDPVKDRDKFAPVTFADGTVEAIRTAEPDKFKKYLASAKDMASGLDDIVAMVDESRWRDKAFRTELAQKIKSTYGMLTLDAKNFFDLGAITEADKDLVANIISDDPMSWRDVKTLLQTTRGKMEDKVRNYLQVSQVPRARDFRFVNRAPAREPDDVASDARTQLKNLMKPEIWSLEEYKRRVDAEVKRHDEEGYSKAFTVGVLGKMLKDAKAAENEDAENYIRGLLSDG